MFEGMSAAILEALIMMIGAAILGGLIVWLLMRERVRTRSVADVTPAAGDDSRLKTQYDALNLAYQQQTRQLEACTERRKTLEDDLALANGFKAQYEEAQAELEQLRNQLVSAGNELRDTKQKAAETEEELLKRLQERAKDINYDRIGRATADEKDDLLIIKGIGPFIEKKLHSIGIYTFRQIGNFTDEDEEKINDVIEFFPGRIKREKWVLQAIELEAEKLRKEADKGK
jgi:predicted flap endonuclease-1-like 5' DNA nuclease